MQLDFDKWNHNVNIGKSIDLTNADFSIVLEKFNQLDQKQFTQIILGGDNDHLIVGGGKGNYVCTFSTNNNDEFYNLINKAASENEDIDLVTGGQEGTFPATIVVGEDAALKALKYYFENQKMNPDLTWEE
ncbi:Imm1 family immunity protein [Pedobacter sp. MR22-3]|uniref:Imm1 family immunity protein n=1 Tax=Pedobacter sp. MR22-3 TaxID=2994552 RepID=UPI0022482473|nr:Imm1 family immunity protein [Pedobacter sp. MR22-3]MCX2584179.1 Imm1 family immunity protein [Pedobacter sp. MR22-3]